MYCTYCRVQPRSSASSVPDVSQLIRVQPQFDHKIQCDVNNGEVSFISTKGSAVLVYSHLTSDDYRQDFCPLIHCAPFQIRLM